MRSTLDFQGVTYSVETKPEHITEKLEGEDAVITDKVIFRTSTFKDKTMLTTEINNSFEIAEGRHWHKYSDLTLEVIILALGDDSSKPVTELDDYDEGNRL